MKSKYLNLTLALPLISWMALRDNNNKYLLSTSYWTCHVLCLHDEQFHTTLRGMYLHDPQFADEDIEALGSSSNSP